MRAEKKHRERTKQWRECTFKSRMDIEVPLFHAHATFQKTGYIQGQHHFRFGLSVSTTTIVVPTIGRELLIRADAMVTTLFAVTCMVVGTLSSIWDACAGSFAHL